VRKFFARSFWLAVVLSFITVVWGLWYVSHRGFSHKWRQRVIAEVEKRGVTLSLGRLTLNPLQGLVAQDVRIWTSREKARALVIAINQVVLDINYSNLIHGEPFLNAAELHDATLSLPLGAASHSSRWLKVSRLNARLLFAPHQLTLEQAEAWVRGMRISASGHVVNPEAFLKPGASVKQDGNPLDGVVQLLDQLNLKGGGPTLDLRFGGDLSQPSKMFAEAIFQCGNFSVDQAYRVQKMQIAAKFADGLLRIEPFTIQDSQGQLDLSASWSLETGVADLRLHSTLDFPDLLRALDVAPALGEISLYAPPVLELTGKADFGKSRNLLDGVQLFGRLSVGRFAVRSVIFEQAGSDFSWEKGRWYLRNSRVQHKNGAFTLNAMQSADGFQFKLDSQIYPNLFFPFLPVEAQTRLSEWVFSTPPVLHLEGHGPRASLAEVDITGQARLGPTQARGIALTSATLDLDFKNNVLTCRNILLTRPEGVGTGTVLYDFNTDELQFQRVQTTLNPVEVVTIFDRDLADVLTPYRFKTRPALVVDGKVGCKRGDFSRNRLRVDVDGSGGMDYTFLKKNLSASKITGGLNIVGDRLKLDGLKASLFGGQLRGHADISIRKAAGDYTAEIFTEEVDFPSITKLYFDFDTSKGKLSSSFAFSGRHDWVKAISGTGTLNVTDGNVFAIPIFGPFSSILEGILPGTGYNDARKGTCTFEMNDGVVSTRDLVMEGKGFSIYGAGKLFVAEDKIDFTARINAQGIPGRLLSPVSHILEYVSDGSLSKPVWRPKLVPKMIWFTPQSAPTPAPVGGPAPPLNSISKKP
jgi:hypothetical protein